MLSKKSFYLGDARFYQLFALFSLLCVGIVKFGFDVPVECIVVIMGSALAAQHVCTHLFHLPSFDPKSALITSFSLCLLLRTDTLWLAGLAAAIAISSKFFIRANNKHIFNPANFAITLLIVLDVAWISPAQWGSAMWFAFLFVCLGGLVVTRAKRVDVTAAFLLCYIGLIFGRALWLGDPLEIPFKQMQSGALLLFAFFMISDPKTIPDAMSGRIIFAASVAALAFTLQFVFYNPNGLMYALTLMAPLTILLDRLLPAARYSWSKQTT